jgi:hypothetical protein
MWGDWKIIFGFLDLSHFSRVDKISENV